MLGHLSSAYADVFYKKQVLGVLLGSDDTIWQFACTTGEDFDIGAGSNKFGFNGSWEFCSGRPLSTIISEYNIVEAKVPESINALNRAIEIWMLLAENGEDIEWKQREYGYKYHCGCPLCSYVKTQGKHTLAKPQCENYCPMFGKWNDEGKNCEASGLYVDWKECEDEDERRYYAQQIVFEMIKKRREMLEKFQKTETKQSKKAKEVESLPSLTFQVEKEEKIKTTHPVTVGFKLVHKGNRITLIACNEKGQPVMAPNILSIGDNGKLHIVSSVNRNIGLKLDSNGRIELDD